MRSPDVAHKLDVWLFNEHVGTLGLVNGRLDFAYAPEWLQRPNAMPLSCSMPLQTKHFDDHIARPFFAGLLPEGRMRQLIAQQLHVSGQNEFALLDHLGGECAGAVTFLEQGTALSQLPHKDDIQWLTDVELLGILDELPHRPMLAGKDGLRLSLAGAQDKLPVIFDGTRIGLPLNGTPSSHILKPAIQAVKASVTNEGFCMALAEAMQLKPAHTLIHKVEDREFLLIERYDRILGSDGTRERLHQEDFCQALGVVSEMKYQNEGGPNLAQCFDLVRRVTRPSAPHVLRLLDYVIFNALIGNHDAHGKNFSLLYSLNGPVLSPFYDTLSTAVYPKLAVKMAMKIGSEYKFTEVYARHWEQFAQEAGLAKPQAKKRILDLAKSLPVTARQLQEDPKNEFAQHEIVEEIIVLIEQRCALTIQRLNDPERKN
ncbi:MAG: type II toxin-antitoxin system HipA family toxin [Betaproteobacteria bacterium]|jgi:serine/threonine-protein kinase HipA|nr:type II toxin-antitoxin system HipA family toxin [Betaproteobacteria bacterium]